MSCVKINDLYDLSTKWFEEEEKSVVNQYFTFRIKTQTNFPVSGSNLCVFGEKNLSSIPTTQCLDWRH